VEGYILTERSAAVLARILPTLTTNYSHRAWTLTGVYGTGKSAFVHYLASLCLPTEHPARHKALEVARQFLSPADPLWGAIEALPPCGLVPAVVTAQQEPLTHTLVRALARGVELFFPPNQRHTPFLRQLWEWEGEVKGGRNPASSQDILGFIQQLVDQTQTPLLLVVDELGKSLEYAAHHGGKTDLYLLQQIAELSLKGKHQVYFLGLLHQSFTGYSDRLSMAEQSEWTKIQGRFEDIPFSESPSQMLRLMGQVIDAKGATSLKGALEQVATAWQGVLGEQMADWQGSAQLLRQVYPLHPLTALVLPLLCHRYAQSDRSLFTFLTSDEPQGFKGFLNTQLASPEQLPTVKLDYLYDYFVETVPGLASRLNFQRWVEVKGLIEDARHQPPEVIRLLKTIGILNLISTSGRLRATPDLVAWALCDRPDPQVQQVWLRHLETLKQKTLITHRQQQDELRLWQGSDFDIETAIAEAIGQNRTSLCQLLTDLYPLRPVVAQRHYTQTGNLRYFERRYGDSQESWDRLTCTQAQGDGLVLYWLDAAPLDQPPP